MAKKKEKEVTVWFAEILCPIFEMRAGGKEEFEDRTQAVKWVQREFQGDFIWIQNKFVSIHTCYGSIIEETKLVEVEEEAKGEESPEDPEAMEVDNKYPDPAAGPTGEPGEEE